MEIYGASGAGTGEGMRKWVEHIVILLLMQISLTDFSVHRIIGRGGFGEVYGCRKDDSGKM